MDYSSSSDDVVSDSGLVIDEPKVVNETHESIESECIEMSHTIDTENNTSVDQTSAIADNDVSDHIRFVGIEVLGSPKTEALEILVTQEM
jgi:hypothetical protein